jgi:SAM-dependent MidA family methyltransferase
VDGYIDGRSGSDSDSDRDRDGGTEELWLPWSMAMDRALYGPDGFYRTQGGPSAHFRTSVHASMLFATAVLRLLRQVDDQLDHPEALTLVDLGAGRGELPANLLALLTAADSDAQLPHGLIERVRMVAVELADRPVDLPAAIGWHRTVPPGLVGLLVANEWLDNVPCDVVELGSAGPRLIEVARDGRERPGPPPGPEQRAWLAAWWPLRGVGARAELGLLRDAAWRQAVQSLDRGVAVAIDYAHERAARPRLGTLSGYARGRQVPPVPDGSCDITAHVALDACAAAGSGSTDWTLSIGQREALHRLGITGARPGLELASSDPRGYLRALSRAGEASELTDRAGLGGFGWLVHGVGVGRPGILED